MFNVKIRIKNFQTNTFAFRENCKTAGTKRMIGYNDIELANANERMNKINWPRTRSENYSESIDFEKHTVKKRIKCYCQQ